MIYTRRVGGTADDGSGLGAVAAAIRINGSLGTFNYGVFGATENDEAGRNFYAVRGTRDFKTQGFGAMVTRVDRPYLDRKATVYEFYHRWNPNAEWAVRTTLVGSQVDQVGTRSDDTGLQVWVDYDRGNDWRQQLYGVHLGENLELNDFGYLARNNYNELRYKLAHRVTDIPEGLAYASEDWQYAMTRRYNDNGVHLADAAAILRFGELRDGGSEPRGRCLQFWS